MLRGRLGAVMAVVLMLLVSRGHGQVEATPAGRADASHNWANVRALPPRTRVHLTTDHGGRTCRVFVVGEDAFTCARGRGAGAVVPRAEIRHIRLAHYVRSALVGAGVGGAVGAISGGVAGRSKPCPADTLCFNGIGGGPGAVAAVFGVAGAVLGSAVGGLTDLARGDMLYSRP